MYGFGGKNYDIIYGKKNTQKRESHFICKTRKKFKYFRDNIFLFWILVQF